MRGRREEISGKSQKKSEPFYASAGVMNRDAFLRKIVPVGLLFSASLVLSNWVYLRLTVSFSKSTCRTTDPGRLG